MERKCLFSLLIFFLAHQLNYIVASPKTNISTDKSALLALKSSITNDPHNILASNWSSTSTHEVCNWIGVTCGARHRRVTALNLIDMGLSATVPPHLGNLSFLVTLNFSHNSFHGTLRGEVSRLHRLERIDFRCNNLTGDIPSGLGFLPKLELLHLNNNLFSGSIPSSLFNKSSLRYINLNHNQLSELGLEGIVSRRGDVYSYGVMLMETFTRKRPTDEMFSGEMSLKQWVENSFSHDITDVIDSNLLSTIEEHYTSKKDCLSSVMELALACSATSPQERTDMKNVAATLKKIKAKFLKDVEE